MYSFFPKATLLAKENKDIWVQFYLNTESIYSITTAIVT